MATEGNETPQEEEQFTPESTEEIASEEVIEETPVEETVETPSEDVNTPTEETPDEPAFYTPEEMKTLQVDGIDTSRIPPEMRALYQAMQSPITRKSQQLSQKMKELEQGQVPLQESTPQKQQTQNPAHPSVDERAVHQTLQNLGLTEKPEAWEEGYENYVLELSDTRRDLRQVAQQRATAFEEFDTFKSGFSEDQFNEIDSEAETRMYALLADPKTRVEGQRIQHAMQTGDTSTVLTFVRGVAKEHLSKPSNIKKVTSNPPANLTPSGGSLKTGGSKDPSKMSNDEYREYRNSQ